MLYKTLKPILDVQISDIDIWNTVRLVRCSGLTNSRWKCSNAPCKIKAQLSIGSSSFVATVLTLWCTNITEVCERKGLSAHQRATGWVNSDHRKSRFLFRLRRKERTVRHQWTSFMFSGRHRSTSPGFSPWLWIRPNQLGAVNDEDNEKQRPPFFLSLPTAASQHWQLNGTLTNVTVGT